MRILVDLGEQQIQQLDALAEKERRSRASVLREAVDAYLSDNRSVSKGQAFGLWRDSDTDGLSYQQKLRSEW